MYILFDIGGTNMRIAHSPDGTTISPPQILPTNPDDFNDSISRLTETAKQLAGSKPITAAAGGIPGPMDKQKTQLITAPNLPAWNNQPLKATLEKAFNAPVYLENDTAMIGLGEAHQGAGQGYGIVAYITVSTGVGGCRIVKGEIAPSAMGFEPGHQIIDMHSNITCGCGGTGHLEGLISGINLKKRYHKDPENITDGAVWKNAAQYLAVGLHNVLTFWSPDIIVLGGSIMHSIDITKVRQYLGQIVHVYKTIPPIELSALGEKAGVTGALEYAKQQHLP